MAKLSKLKVVVFCAAISLLAFGACRNPYWPGTTSDFAYQGISEGFDYPAVENKLSGYVDAGDGKAIRQHAWNLWAGITADSQWKVGDQTVPVFETWYSAIEVFDDHFKNTDGGRPVRKLQHKFEIPRQSIHSRAITGNDRVSPVMSFVKYNEPAADFIWDNKYYLKSTLQDLNASFDKNGTPRERREIKPFPNTSIVLKVVFWLIKNPSSPEVEDGLTPLPFWDPDHPPPADGRLPTHDSWTQCVAVDPAGKFAINSRHRINCNGTKEDPRWVDAEVIPLSRFYSYRLNSQEDADDASKFLAMVSGASGKEERLVANLGQTPEVGDHIVLTAMHLTTKEMDNWTFQTFWWSPQPDATPNGDDRTANVVGAWRNYQMCTAYDMVTPKTSAGAPSVCFNPYLETDLGPTKPYVLAGRSLPPDPMAGTRSNCMTCHARSGFPALDKNNSSSANFGRVYNEGYIPPDDQIFSKITKTDFLWSIALHSQPQDQP